MKEIQKTIIQSQQDVDNCGDPKKVSHAPSINPNKFKKQTQYIYNEQFCGV